MSLFGKKFDPNVDLAPAQDKGFEHLSWVVQPGKAIAREPKQKGSGGTVVILPYPQFDVPGYKEKKLVYADRTAGVDDEPEFGYQRWMFVASGVRKFGKNSVTMLFDNPDDSGFSLQEHHPVGLIVDAAWKAFKGQMVSTPLGTSDSDKWNELLKGDDKKQNCYACLSKPDNLAILNVLVYALGTQRYPANMPLGGVKSEPQCLWVMSRNTAGGFIKQLREPDGAPRPITGSKVFHFYDKKNPGSCEARTAALMASQGGFSVGEQTRRASPMQQGSDGGGELSGYDVFVSDSITGRPDDPMVPAKARQKVVEYAVDKLLPWEQVLRGHTPEQCANIIATKCGLPHSLLYHAWQSHPKWYSEELKFLLKRPSTTQMGAGAAPAQTQQQATPAAAEGGMGMFDGLGGAGAPAAEQPAARDGFGDFPTSSGEWDGPVEETPEVDSAETEGFDASKVKEANEVFRKKMSERSGVSAPTA